MVLRTSTLAALLSAVAITGVNAGTASAGSPPITGTEVSTFEESFSDEPFLCQDELYAQTSAVTRWCTSRTSRIPGRFTSTRTITARP